jgi:hypothetical protein
VLQGLVDETDEKEARSLRDELAALKVAGTGEGDVGYNAAIDDVLEIVDRHEHDRQTRSAHAIARRKAQGKKIGGDTPYGYELAPDGETLRESAAEQRVIKEARKLRSAGHSLREVARRLAARNMFPREGDQFHAAQIKRMTDEKT